MTHYSGEAEMRIAVNRILLGAEFIGFVLVAVPGWRGYVELFESADGKACAWRTDGDSGEVQAVLYKHSVDSPLAAVEEWLATRTKSN